MQRKQRGDVNLRTSLLSVGVDVEFEPPADVVVGGVR
jgi:hypothetical protein